MIVPFAAGGPIDTIARLLAQSMGTHLKQQIIVENVGGAGGKLGAARAARSTPDGYTIFVHHVGHATAPSLYRKLSYNCIDSFEPIGLATDATSTLIARHDFPAKDVKELLAYVRANKEKVTLANAPVRHALHERGRHRTHDRALQSQASNTMSHIKSGKVKAYAVTYKNTVASLPGLPPLASAGLPGFELSVWHGVYAPVGTPKAVVNKLSSALQFAVKDAAVKQRWPISAPTPWPKTAPHPKRCARI